MKTILFNAEKMYESPVVFEIKVNVERGFAQSSGRGTGEDPEEGDNDGGIG